MHRDSGKPGTGLCLGHSCSEGLTRTKPTKQADNAASGISQHYTLGIRGEDIAAKHLMQQGLQILERRWKGIAYEVDIIAFDPATEEIVFVEVKTRASAQWGEPEKAIDLRKIRRIVRAANQYLKLQHINYPARFDVYSIIATSKETKEIVYIKNAFYPPLG